MIEGRDIIQLREQMMGLEVTRPDGSVHLKIHHRTEGIHDDDPDALANACWAAKRLSSVPVSAEFLEYDEIKEENDDCKHVELKSVEGELFCKACGEDR